MGMIAYVYTMGPKEPHPVNAIVGKFSRVTVVNVEGPFEPSADRPAVRLEQHRPGVVRVVPCSEEGVIDQKIWWMFGGAFVATSDSRFAAQVATMLGHEFYGALPLHDRNEAA